MPDNSNWMLSVVAGALAGGSMSLIVETIKRRMFAPKLEIKCANSEEFTPLATVPGPFASAGPEVETRYLRLSVRNKSEMKTTAKSCRAYLTDINEVHNDGTLQRAGFADVLRLRWAYEGPDGDLHKGVDIPIGISVHFDLFSSHGPVSRVPPYYGDEAPEERILQFANRDAREAPEFRNLLRLGSTYIFTVMVTADEVDATTAHVKIRIGPEPHDVWIADFRHEVPGAY